MKDPRYSTFRTDRVQQSDILGKPNHPVLHAVLANYILFFFLFFLLYEGSALADARKDIPLSLHDELEALRQAHPRKSGAYIFEKGEEALLARAWLTEQAAQTIDVQYFIWSTDNIGILAAESLLKAAERGVRVRVLVDDLLIDAPGKTMIALNAHPNIQIRIYNPKHSVGISKPEQIMNLVFNFRSSNQRMHDKTFTVDDVVSITGGRNMADEYFDYDQSYNFRDRDILLLGPVVEDVADNFENFWNSEFVKPVEKLLNYLAPSLPSDQCEKIYAELHEYARDPINFRPEVRKALQDLHRKLPALSQALIWDDITFAHDSPGKNDSKSLNGGGTTTGILVKALTGATESIIIQSPYLVMPDGGIDFFRDLVNRGVEVKISTNSMASTDNLQAFSGYYKQRKDILAAGVKIYEFKPSPSIQATLIDRYHLLEKAAPTFAIHAKSMVIDHQLLFVGTFNLDPRSANLNTEVGVLIRNQTLARQLEESIRIDMLPENSWDAATDSPDRYASLGKKLKVYFWRMLPLTPLL